MYRFKTKHSEYNVIIEKKQYTNGRTAIQLIDKEDGCPVMIATVNIPEEILEKDEVIIKDYSENEGMLDFLLTNDIVTLTDQVIESGYVRLYVCILNPEFVWGITQAYEEYQYEQHFNEY